MISTDTKQSLMQKNIKDSNIHVKQLQKQANLIKKGLAATIAKQSATSNIITAENKIHNHMNIVNTYLNRVFLLLLINRIECEHQNSKNDEIMVVARKEIAAILSRWEEQVGREFNDLHNDKLPLHQHRTNHEIFAHFQKIGCAIDFFDVYYKEDARWQTSLLTIRNRFLICFCNALNFKKLIKENDPAYNNYIENSEIIELLKNIFDEYVQAYWNQNVKNNEFNSLELNKALALIQFFKNFSSVIADRETHDNYKKKYTVWKKYIQERSKEENKKTEQKQQNILATQQAEKEKTKKKFFTQ